ncbi:hypothetical protein B0T14DRAFT_108670 [Immersiella caudata]|uniref:Uncharacterized protein n=1 Tax=Immersiella caudata TaxID=314043 RepID=A0AA39X3N3_9PEZI|nr:hypothetical protein B0T14DRAFT_108670 [Immersiella caudata]
MAERDDFDTFLRTGSFRTSRSRSPNPDRVYDRPAPETLPYRPDVRSSRSSGRPQRVRGPPPASVEDEVESLAREYSSSIPPSQPEDEPKNRGEIDQFPLMVEVFDENPERRFVIVTNSETGADDAGDTTRFDPRQSPTKSEYDENTCRQYVHVSSDKRPSEPAKAPGLTKRKSHRDLPRLETESQPLQPPPEPSIRRSNSRRNREKAVVDQPSRESAQPNEDAYLSPVVTHTAGGRERAYLDFNAGSRSPSGRAHSRENSKSARNDDRGPTRSSASPSVSRRRMSSTAGSRPYLNPMVDGYGHGNADAVIAFMNPGGDLPPPPRGNWGSESPTKTRKSNSPPYPDLSRDRLPERPAGQRSRRESSTRDRPEYYGSESLKSSRSNRSDRPRPRRTGTEPDSLLSPDRSRTGPKGPSPLPSPRAAQGSQFQGPSSLPSPRSSTLPYPSGGRREDESPPRRQEENGRGPRPRAPSRSTSIPNSSVPLPIPISLGRGSSSDRRIPAITREESQDPSSPVVPYWQPPLSDPEKKKASGQQITTFKQYSEDVQRGSLPRPAECRWIVPIVPDGDVQFLSLQGAENFLICPDCYGDVFAKNEDFKRFFVDAPDRPPDKAVSCNFGSSPWYRIAFILTLKHQYQDLRLLEAVASVDARRPPCPGPEVANRVWYSIVDPSTRRLLDRFDICPSCVGMVTALLPNLAEAFEPVESHDTLFESACDFYYAPDRRRFMEFFNLMETTHDRSLDKRGGTDIQTLADRIRDISLEPECPRNAKARNRKWYVAS